MSWQGALTAFFWASLVRVALLHHVTWAINSICHTFGSEEFEVRDRSRNVSWLAIASFGESWHNLHHADPTCARHGALKGQLDPSARVIWAFEKLGWAYDVRWPDEDRLAAKRPATATQETRLDDTARRRGYVARCPRSRDDEPVSSQPQRSGRKRMTGKERREQLLDIGRRLFAERGFEGTSIEEIAAQAGVSKPVVYEHFGGKEGLYAVVVDREVERLLTMATTLLGGDHTREKFEAAAVALLRYIDDNADGFRILVRDSNPGSGTGTYGTLLSDIAGQVEYILADFLASRGHDPKLAPLYAQMLVGMVAFTGQWWLDARKPKLEEVAANLIDLAWNGLSQLDANGKDSSQAVAPGRRRGPA